MLKSWFVVPGSLLLSAGLAGCLWGAATVGGTLSGLPDGTAVTLQNNGMDNLTLRANGRFEFARTLDEGESYAVTVLTQPAGANCTVANGSGTIADDDIDDVAVSCVSNASVTGTVTGLAAGTFVRLANAGATIDVTADGAFAFPGILADGATYDVTVQTQPLGQTCSVADGAGTVASGRPTAIAVTCS